MCKSIILEDLLKDGVTKKFATFYIDLVQKELKNSAYNQEYVKWAHSKGFLAESAYAYGLNENNVNDYLSDYDYYKTWPLNDWSRIWINDKLTLKQILGEDEYKNFMPKYYFYTSVNGMRHLKDCPKSVENLSEVEAFKKVLKEVRDFACKPCNGTASKGFEKLSFVDGVFMLNDEPFAEEEIGKFIFEHPNYVFTEHIYPSKQFAKYSSKIHTLRLVTLNVDGNNPKIIGGYLRIPHSKSGVANYVVIGAENKDDFNIFLEINEETGAFGNARITLIDGVKPIETHPDTGEKLSGEIKDYSQLKAIVLGIAKKLNTLTYMGFDIGITDNGFKCMEINSHPGIKYMQIFKSLYKNEETSSFFKAKLQEVDNLTQEEKQRRINIVR